MANVLASSRGGRASATLEFVSAVAAVSLTDASATADTAEDAAAGRVVLQLLDRLHPFKDLSTLLWI